jgi:hypothetical protein
MQVVVLVHCSKGKSLRDAVVARLNRSVEKREPDPRDFANAQT